MTDMAYFEQLNGGTLSQEDRRYLERNGALPSREPPLPPDLRNGHQREPGDESEFDAVDLPADAFDVLRNGDDDGGRPANLQNGKPLKRIDCPQEMEAESKRLMRRAIEKFTFGELREQYPKLHPPVIDGVVRLAETMNNVSVSKIGKSWFLYHKLLCIVTGRPWLGRYDVWQGPCLLIDNELHKPTIQSRIHTVAEAMGIPESEYANDLHIWTLRGNLRDIHEIGDDLAEIGPDLYRLVAFDAKYRMQPHGKSENDNAAETEFYNLQDTYAAMLNATIDSVHHSSKGSQSDKRVTDVGSGAGAQSRAADVHLILREHEEPDCVVMDAALRSFKPIQPVVLKWCFPLWVPQAHLDPSLLKGRKNPKEEKQSENDRDGINKLIDALRKEPLTVKQLRGKGVPGKARCERLLDILEAGGHVTYEDVKVRGNWTRLYTLIKSEE